MTDLPTPHSPLGASSAERWMNCPGSATLVALLRGDREEDPDWTAEGSEAHLLGSTCLNSGMDPWQIDPAEFPRLTVEMMDAVQVHVNYARSLPGTLYVEERMHRPEFHEQAYGTADVAVINLDQWHPGIEIVDHKHGIGVVVEIEENAQVMYYAFLKIQNLALTDDTPVRLTIVQPRVTWHPDGVIRSWDTTVGFIRDWAYNELLPAMVATQTDAYLDTGEHCRFCPAKLVCPAMMALGNRVTRLTEDDIKNLPADVLADLLGKVPVLAMLTKALKAEGRRRMIAECGKLPGWKVVPSMADRVWRQGAPLLDKFGMMQIWKPQALRSPAEIEKLPGGKEFVSEWAYRPEAGYDIVPEADRRKAVPMETAIETFKNVALPVDTPEE